MTSHQPPRAGYEWISYTKRSFLPNRWRPWNHNFLSYLQLARDRSGSCLPSVHMCTSVSLISSFNIFSFSSLPHSVLFLNADSQQMMFPLPMYFFSLFWANSYLSSIDQLKGTFPSGKDISPRTSYVPLTHAPIVLCALLIITWHFISKCV